MTLDKCFYLSELWLAHLWDAEITFITQGSAKRWSRLSCTHTESTQQVRSSLPSAVSKENILTKWGTIDGYENGQTESFPGRFIKSLGDGFLTLGTTINLNCILGNILSLIPCSKIEKPTIFLKVNISRSSQNGQNANVA